MIGSEGASQRTAVVLCTYNGERFLSAQLGSLRRQTIQPTIYVLSDDASTDGTWRLLEAFATDRRSAGCEVVLHRNDINLGYVRHFEQALGKADAELLFPCDQDDVWHPNKIERMAAVFEQRPALLVLHADANLVDAEGQATGRRLLEVLEVSPAEMQSMHEGRAFEVLLRRNIVTGAAMAFRRSLLATALPIGDGWSHDEWIAIFGAMIGDADTLEAVLIDYRQHGGNQIGVQSRQGLQHIGMGMERSAFMWRAEARWQVLQSRVLDSPALASRAVDLRERSLHAQARSNRGLPFTEKARIVWREWRTGRYARFGRGARSALADLMGID